MNFENNWVFLDDFPGLMYDPILKIRVSHSRGPTGAEEFSLRINYDPEIRDGQYEVPAPDELRLKYGLQTVAFKSEKSIEIANFGSLGKVIGSTLRIKFYDLSRTRYDPVLALQEKFGWLRDKDVPIVSAFPAEFVLYVLNNAINLGTWHWRQQLTGVLTPAKRVELCVQRRHMVECFNLRLADYEEVEPGWFCLQSRLVTPGEVTP